MSIHTYTRATLGDGSLVTARSRNASGNTLAKETELALSGKNFTLHFDADTVFKFVDTLTAGEVTTLDGVVSTFNGDSPANPGAQQGQTVALSASVDDSAESNTTSNVFATKLTLSAGQFLKGTFQIYATARIYGNNASTVVECRLWDGTDSVELDGVVSGERKDKRTASFMANIPLDRVNKDFQLQWRRSSGGGSAQIANAHIELRRLG